MKTGSLLPAYNESRTIGWRIQEASECIGYQSLVKEV